MMHTPRASPPARDELSSFARQANWYAFGMAAIAMLLSVRLGANWFVALPVLFSGIPLCVRGWRAAMVSSVLAAAVDASVILLGSMTVGRYFVASAVAQLVAIAFYSARNRGQVPA